MKKLIVIVALVAVACAPAMAVVNVKVGHEKIGTTVTVRYCTDGNSVRAFALDMSVSSGTISAVSCTSAAPLGYYVYPGSIQISGGSVTGNGTCVCTAGFGGALGGVGTSGVTVEMGSLYTGSTKPATSGTLLTFTISDSAANVTIGQNTARGGVVMENPAETPTVTIAAGVPSCVAAPTECFPSGLTGYSDWKTLGKPNCWCGTITAGMSGTPVAWGYQCDGDAANTTLSSYRVYTDDYAKMWSNWKKKTSTAGLDACADITHATLSSYRVYTDDYARIWSNWKKKTTALPGNCPR